MATDVVMPQMGESIAEGTIVRWIKKVGDKVDRDEPLFEISTDKVDAEIPSPAAGVVSEIRVKEGETVPVNSVVAVIGASGEAKAAAAQKPVEEPATPVVPAAKPVETPKPSPQADGSPTAAARPAPEPPSPPPPPAPGAAPAQEARAVGASTEELIRQRSSPLVRKIAKEHNVDISQLHGTGIAGRVTKDDILGFLDKGALAAPVQAERGEGVPAERVRGAGAPGVSQVALDSVEKMSPMRKRIAEHMIQSRRTSAHVHSVFEVNFSRVAQAREKHKAEFERAGTKLTYLSFIVKAAIDALRAVPVVNASVDGDTIVYHKEINVGIAVALDWGLIVPVIKHADEKNLLGLSRAIADLANRARAKQLKPEEVQGGTFTITNPGVFGALFGMPIINQPQVAIVGVGNVEKRPVVIEDAIAIRPMAYLSIGYDHRIIDGAVADEFMSHIKKTLEAWDPNVG
jgi:2-oxoglutarate dehydrogenase E2 component (dihydrolipoamide succinyltransferase)